MNGNPGREAILSRLGFSFETGGAHTARTMMLAELRLLLEAVPDPTAGKAEYFRNIREENCLGKRSERTRTLTARHLADLYGLDPDLALFRALRFFWPINEQAQPLLALLCAFARDPLLRMSAPLIKALEPGQILTRETMEDHVEKANPDRFSPATLKSLAQNINGTWTYSGHLRGRQSKVRDKACATQESVAYCLFLGYLWGERGESLLQGTFCSLLDAGPERVLELAESGSRRGWFVLKRIGKVMEFQFPELLTDQEREWLREQG